MRNPSQYYDFDKIAEHVAAGEHRGVVGGLWDELGRLQFDFLLSQGLQRSHRLIDIGCGSLRAGVHLIEYLDPGNYYGTDINQSLLDAGYDIELVERKIQSRLPRDQLRCDGDFAFSAFGVCFDVALAHSLLTHLPVDYTERCLANLATAQRAGGRFFATIFSVPDAHPVGEPYQQAMHTTFDDQDPYHYRLADLFGLCESLPWRPHFIGDWGHPRGQQMVMFERI